jgi:hypothetical protein
VAAQAEPLRLTDGYLFTRTEALWSFQAAE